MTTFSIHKAALEGQPGLIRSLLSDDAKLINSRDADGRTPLHWAASSSNLGVMQLLLENQPDLEARDSMGFTALMIAASSGNMETLSELLNAGAQVDATNEKGQTSLHYAASKGHTHVGRALIAKGADINVKDRASQFPLHRAATTGSEAFLSLLLNPPEGRTRTRLNGPDRAGNTPLHLAMESGHGAAAVLLIEAGADRERVSRRIRHRTMSDVVLGVADSSGLGDANANEQSNADGQVPEEIDGVGGQEQKNVRQFVVSKVGPRDE